LEEKHENMKNQRFNFKDFLSNLNSSKKIKIITIVVLFIVILFIFSSSFLDGKSNENSEPKNTIVSSKSYAENTEERLKNILINVNGIDNVKVFIYTESSEEVVYLKDTETIKSNSDNGNSQSKETTVVNKNGTFSSAVVVVTKYPKIQGVLIVAHGVSDVKLKLKIIDAISCVLSIAPTSIEVLEGKS